MSRLDEVSRAPQRGASASQAPYPKLHPGPGAASQQVASHQRARIYAAMIELVAERGFGAVTVRELVRRAGVSTHTFYEHFQDKDTCFLCTYELIVRRSRQQVGIAQKDCHDWRERLRLAFRAWVRGIAREPKAARLALVEAFAGGPAALEQMRRAEGMFEAMIAQSFAAAPDAVPVPPLLVKGTVAGVHRVARARLQSGRAYELPGLADELLEWVLCFRCQAATAFGQLDARSAPARPDTAMLAIHAGGVSDARVRILDAVAQLAAREGYWQLTVPRIRAAAGVSRKRFDEHFQDVQGCFITALEHHTTRVFADAASAGMAGETWPGALHQAICALCTHIASDPVFARLVFIEVFSPGLEGMRCRSRIIDSVASAFRASAPVAQRPSQMAAEASVGAVWGIMHRYIASGQGQRLPHLTPTLSFLALAPALGAQQALAAITAEQTRMCATEHPSSRRPAQTAASSNRPDRW